MAALGFLILASACLAAHGFPEEPVRYRNSIFAEETLEGGIFEDVDAFNEISLYNTASNNPFRLPTTTRPQHYNIDWTIDIATLSFSGDVEIELYATQPNVNQIVLHAFDLDFSSLVLRQGNTEVYQTYSFQPEYHFLRVQLNTGSLAYNATEPVIYTLSISFSAPLRNDMYGIYRSWFRNNYTDQVSWMASTQFQGTSARFAFPCYDEPSFKAVFDITITRPVTHRSWSCTRQAETRNTTNPLFEQDVYYPTPVMSTYLIALIVAEYDSLEVNENGLLRYEVIARPAAIATGQGQYAYDVGQELLDEMNNHTALDFFGVHPTIKMTQAAIPDFSAGAMENWGLLTYREAYLMYSDEHTQSYYRQLIAYILSHEIAHMWFGNLVTCDWWDVLWLNEGFARYYQYFLTHWVEDYMGLQTRFITEQIHTALLTDSANNPFPLYNPGVGSPASVSAMFGLLSYNKGAALIRMTEHLMGFENHRLGLRNYLSGRAHQTALPSTLYQYLQQAADETGAIAQYGPSFNIPDYYRTWIDQPGHPVLNVDVNHQTGQMTIYQRRFNINSGYSTAASNWIIPITFSTASNPDFEDTKPTHIIRDAITVINRTSIGDEWVIFNKQQIGYFRVNYDDYTWNLITILLRSQNRTIVHEYNRAQIVNDVFQFARSGLMTYTQAFNILSFLQFETEYAPWVAAITGFNWINNRVIGTPLEAPLNNMFIGWAQNIMNDLTYYPIANETFMRSYLRYQLAPVMCRLGNQACIQAAVAQFQALVNNGVEVPADSRNWVYCNGLRNGTPQDFNFLWNRFLQHNVYTEKIVLLQVLGCTPHAVSLNSYLTEIMQENFIIRRQDYTTALNSAVTGNEGNTQIAFTFMQNNLDLLRTAFNNIATPLSYVSARLRTAQQVEEYRQWALDNQGALGTSFATIYNGATASLNALQWTAEVQDDLNNYISNGDQVLQPSTAAPVTTPPTPVTVTPGPLIQPSTPDIPDVPDSAVTSALSVLAVAVAAFANYLM